MCPNRIENIEGPDFGDYIIALFADVRGYFCLQRPSPCFFERVVARANRIHIGRFLSREARQREAQEKSYRKCLANLSSRAERGAYCP